MRELYLHIGPQKTGSTYIQKVFLNNINRLSDAGFDYAPDPDPEIGAHYRFLHHMKTRDMGEVLAELAAACPGEKVLVSNEDFAKFLLLPSLRPQAAPGRLIAHDLAEAARAAGFHPRLIYFARRQDHLAESHCAQGAKTWYSGSIPHYPRQNYNHDHDLGVFESIFGIENISLHLYRDGEKQDVLGSLFASMGLTVPETINRDIGRQNSSIHRRKTLFLAAVPKNRHDTTGWLNPAGTSDFIFHVIETSQAIADDGIRFALSPALRRDLVAEFCAGNQAVVARYGIADPGAFVELPALDPRWREPARITPAELAAVFGEVVAAYWREKPAAEALGMTLRLPIIFAQVARRIQRPRIPRNPPQFSIRNVTREPS